MKGSIEDKIKTFKEISQIIGEFKSRLEIANESVSTLYNEIRRQGKWEDYHADNFKYSFLKHYQVSLENAVDTLQAANVHVEFKLQSLQKHTDS